MLILPSPPRAAHLANAVRVVAQNAEQLGGDTATTELPEDYVGNCALVTQEFSGRKVHAVFPSLEQACFAAGFAINPMMGGYGSVTIEAASHIPITHLSWDDWTFA